jgi:hypothetical protein
MAGLAQSLAAERRGLPARIGLGRTFPDAPLAGIDPVVIARPNGQIHVYAGVFEAQNDLGPVVSMGQTLKEREVRLLESPGVPATPLPNAFSAEVLMAYQVLEDNTSLHDD